MQPPANRPQPTRRAVDCRKCINEPRRSSSPMQTSIAQSIPVRTAPAHDPPGFPGADRPRGPGDAPVLFGLHTIVGQSHAMRRVVDQIQQVAATDSTVLLLGETGTGK